MPDEPVPDDQGPGVAPGQAAPPAAVTGRPPRRRRGYLLPGAIALVVLAALAALIDLVGLQTHTPATLAGPDVATRIAQGVQAGPGDHRLPQVSCPPSEPVRAGQRFTCVEHPAGGGAAVTLEVVETGGGAFTWKPLAG